MLRQFRAKYCYFLREKKRSTPENAFLSDTVLLACTYIVVLVLLKTPFCVLVAHFVHGKKNTGIPYIAYLLRS